MKKQIAKWFLFLGTAVISGSAFFAANSAKADISSTDLNNLCSCITTGITNFIREYIVQPSSYYISSQATPVMKANSQQIALPSTVANKTNADTSGYLQNNVLFVPNSFNQSKQTASLIPQSSQQVAKLAGNFDSSALMNKLTLNNDDITNAKNLITFLAGGGVPVQALPASLVNTTQTPPMYDFLNSFGSYSAQQSMGLNALYQLYEERQPVSGLPNNMSALEYDATNATRRMQSSWMSMITSNNFTAADSMRENLVIAAETRYELFAVRMQLERMTALLATTQLQQQQAINKPLLLAAKAKAIQTSSSNKDNE